MHPSFLLTVTLAVLTASLHGQSGSYVLFGDGCRSSGNNNCLDCNGTYPTPVPNPEQRSRYALEVVPSAGTLCFGFQLLTGSRTGQPVKIRTAYYIADNFGAPLGPIETSEMEVGTADGWYPSIFATVRQLKAGRRVFFVFDGTADIKTPVVNAPAAKIGRHFTASVGSSAFSGPFQNRAWAWRLMCTPSGPAIPAISNVGTPRLDHPMQITLALAPSSARAALLFGTSDKTWQGATLPFSLQSFGAPGCHLLVSFDVHVPLTTGPFGQASFTVQVPNSPQLLGTRFFNQWFVEDSAANSLGVVVSPGAVGVVGR